MLNSDRLTERALLPVALVSSPCIRAFAALPADIFATTTIGEGQVVSGVTAGCARRHRHWSFQGHNFYGTLGGGVTALSTNRETLLQNPRKPPLELPTYFFACFLTSPIASLPR